MTKAHVQNRPIFYCDFTAQPGAGPPAVPRPASLHVLARPAAGAPWRMDSHSRFFKGLEVEEFVLGRFVDRICLDLFYDHLPFIDDSPI